MFQFSSRVPARTVVLFVNSRVPGERRAVEALAGVEAASLAQRIGDDVVRDRVVPTAVDRDAVRERGRLHRVVVEDVARVLVYLRIARRHVVGPHRHRIVARVAEERVDDLRVRDAAAEVDPVADHVRDDRVAHRQVVHRPVEPEPHLRVMDVEPVDRRVAQRASDAVHLVCVHAVADIALDREVRQMDVVAASAVVDVLAVEADARMHRAVGKRRGSVTWRPRMIVHQLPAPSILTSSTTMWRFTW